MKKAISLAYFDFDVIQFAIFLRILRHTSCVCSQDVLRLSQCHVVQRGWKAATPSPSPGASLAAIAIAIANIAIPRRVIHPASARYACACRMFCVSSVSNVYVAVSVFTPFAARGGPFQVL